jgi:hypothetical protein
LHLCLLDSTAKNPGISRRSLQEATGNRIEVDDMEGAFAILEAQHLAERGLSQHEGGGRLADCWWVGPRNDPSDDGPGDDDPGNHNPSDPGKGVRFTMG